MTDEKEKIKEEVKEVVEEEMETKIPTSPETKTKSEKKKAAEEIAEEVSETVAPEVSEKLEDSEEEKPEKKKEKKEGRTGIAYIKSSGNNTIVHITDLAGNTISRVSGGMVTKHSRLKANPTIAMFVAKRAAERPKDLGFTKLYVRMRGKTGGNNGPGANSAVKSLGKVFDLISILDATRVPRGGPKKAGGRRGRRV